MTNQWATMANQWATNTVSSMAFLKTPLINGSTPIANAIIDSYYDIFQKQFSNKYHYFSDLLAAIFLLFITITPYAILEYVSTFRDKNGIYGIGTSPFDTNSFIIVILTILTIVILTILMRTHSRNLKKALDPSIYENNLSQSKKISFNDFMLKFAPYGSYYGKISFSTMMGLLTGFIAVIIGIVITVNLIVGFITITEGLVNVITNNQLSTDSMGYLVSHTYVNFVATNYIDYLKMMLFVYYLFVTTFLIGHVLVIAFESIFIIGLTVANFDLKIDFVDDLCNIDTFGKVIIRSMYLVVVALLFLPTYYFISKGLASQVSINTIKEGFNVLSNLKISEIASYSNFYWPYLFFSILFLLLSTISILAVHEQIVRKKNSMLKIITDRINIIESSSLDDKSINEANHLIELRKNIRSMKVWPFSSIDIGQIVLSIVIVTIPVIMQLFG